MASSKVNTTETIFKDSKKTDAELAAKALENDKVISKGKKVKFKCSPVYAALYPQLI